MDKSFKLFVCFLLCCPCVLFIGLRIMYLIKLDINCTGHLKRAADANTITLAHKELKIAVDYLEKNNFTSGSTHIFFATPDLDIGFWYNNLKASLLELEKVDPKASQLEQSNVLMKLRETLVDHGQSVSVTCPDGFSIFPHNVGFYVFGILSCFLACVGMIAGCFTLVDEF